MPAMETLKASDKRLVSYAVDLGTRITTQSDSTSSIGAAQETQLAGLRDRLAELRKKRAALKSDLNSLIEKMEF